MRAGGFFNLDSLQVILRELIEDLEQDNILSKQAEEQLYNIGYLCLDVLYGTEHIVSNSRANELLSNRVVSNITKLEKAWLSLYVININDKWNNTLNNDIDNSTDEIAEIGDMPILENILNRCKMAIALYANYTIDDTGRVIYGDKFIGFNNAVKEIRNSMQFMFTGFNNSKIDSTSIYSAYKVPVNIYDIALNYANVSL